MQKFHFSFYIHFIAFYVQSLILRWQIIFKCSNISLCSEFTHNKVTNVLLYFVFRISNETDEVDSFKRNNIIIKWLINGSGCVCFVAFSLVDIKNKIKYFLCPHALDYDYLSTTGHTFPTRWLWWGQTAKEK